MKPPFSYYGGKTRLARTIAGLLPRHSVYLEPFAGSLAVLFSKQVAPIEVVNDIDTSVVTFFRVLRDQPEALARACELSPYARSEWKSCADVDDPAATELERARRFWVRVTQSFAAKPGSGTGWSCSTSRCTAPSVSTMTTANRLLETARRLRRVSIECCDAVEFIERLARPEACIYVDPPYVFDTRVGLSKRPGGDYRHELDDDGHKRLATALHATPAAVVLSGYPSELYDELYGDWRHIDFRTFASAGARNGGQLGVRTERLWINRPVELGSLFARPTLEV